MKKDLPLISRDSRTINTCGRGFAKDSIYQIVKFVKKFFNYSFLCSSGFLIMFIPKCSFSPYFKNKLDEDVVHVFQRVIVEDDMILSDDLLIEDPQKSQDEK